MTKPTTTTNALLATTLASVAELLQSASDSLLELEDVRPSSEDTGAAEDPVTIEELLEDLTEDELKELAKELGVKGRSIKALLKGIGELELSVVQETLDELFPEEGDDKGDADELDDINVADLSDEEVKDLAKHLGVKGRSVKALRDGLGKVDQDELNEAYDEVFPEEGDEGDEGDGDEGDDVTLDDLQELAAKLLKAGERRTLKSILDEVNVKALSAAKPKDFPALFDALSEAVAEL